MKFYDSPRWPCANTNRETGIHIPSTPVRNCAIATDIRVTRIYIRATATHSQEIAINWSEIASYIEEIAADIKEMAVNIEEIASCTRRTAAAAGKWR